MEAAATNEHNEKIDPDVLKGREDILRARKAADNRQPSAQDPVQSPGKSHTDPDLKKTPPQNVPREPSPMMKAVVDANRRKRSESGTPDVPAFDVAQKILVRQRQAAAAKRTAPLKTRTTEPAKLEYIQTRIDQIEYNRPSYNKLVSEIVARDIDRLCRG